MNEEPLVMCLTNMVAANFTANVLLAIGAKPAMVEDPDEASELACAADAVLVNVGTVTRRQAEVFRSAVASANRHAVPWVLDPVACQCLGFRRKVVMGLLSAHPALVRGNAEEIAFLRANCADRLGDVPLLATGRTDCVYRGDEKLTEVSGGVEMLRRVTATGCAQGAVSAAFLGWGKSPEAACVLSSRLMKAAGERAYARVQKPGSFQIALVDALHELAGEMS